MKNSLAHVLKVLLVGGLFALLGLVLAGCDGGGGADLPDAGSDARAVDAQPQVDVLPGTDARGPGLGRTDAGMVFCEIPSPAREWAEVYRGGGLGNFLVVTGDVVKICEAWKAANPTVSVLSGYPYQVSSNNGAVLQELSTAGVDCTAVSEDFRGSTGIFWGVSVVAEDGFSVCDGTPDGSKTCEIVGLIPLVYSTSAHLPDKTLVRSWALCTKAGAFSGWLSTKS